MNEPSQKAGRAGLQAVEFEPLEQPGKGRKLPISPGYLVVIVVAILAASVLLYLFAARAVIFLPEPESAQLDVSGISFNIGNNYLLLRGRHEVTATAAGYHDFSEQIEVGPERTQEIELTLEPLPGRLNVVSELEDVEVSIDGEAVGTVPGVIADISRGSHIVEFSKHRYFPLRQEIEIEGLGTTQDFELSLEPAWGQMAFSTIPAGAELLVDGQSMGQTPLTTEVLETGSQVSIVARGYKTWEREVTVKAGEEEEYPTIEMIVADGTLDISTAPRGASVTIDGEFRGTAPLSVPLSPLSAHRVELFLEGYRKASRNVSVEPEQRSSLSLSLTPIIGRIALSVSPADAEVLVNGARHGTGSQDLSLTAREHRVTVRKPGYEAQEFTLRPRPDHDQALDVKLLTLQQAYWSRRPDSIASPVGTPMKLFRPERTFTLGAPRREPGRRANEAERKVTLERPFYISTHEITNAEFRYWKEEHTSRALRGNTLDMDTQPVVHVSWQEAAIFCNWLSRREGLPLFYIEQNGLVNGINIDAHGYRLPTEAEWAYVAKISSDGETMMFPWGGDQYPPVEVVANYADRSAAALLSFSLSNYDDGYAVSAPVGSFEPNARGIHDLGGNVSEWISDYYEIRASRGDPELDPTGPVTGSRHVIRGASWAMGSRSELRLSYRDAGMDRRMDVGFRIARYVDKANVEP
ncbi:MAG: PEGA domain-containing protein [Xanthomonadales bacterium]|nr:PEGA domain-containing protein [Xanthomonadales bacterium]NNL96281.1 PEGA domain-containing protein [Xanthomonadales bacterium]